LSNARGGRKGVVQQQVKRGEIPCIIIHAVHGTFPGRLYNISTVYDVTDWVAVRISNLLSAFLLSKIQYNPDI
jgi:hypothetical protein